MELIMIKRILVCVLFTFALASIAQACPMCKDSIPNSDAQQAGSLPLGFNHSVYFVLVGFLTVLGTTVTMIVRAVRGTNASQVPGFQVIDPKRRPPTQH
jgi:hypothetical protein